MNNNYIHSKSMGGKRSKSSARSAAPTQPPPVPMAPGAAKGDNSSGGPPQQECSNKINFQIAAIDMLQFFKLKMSNCLALCELEIKKIDSLEDE